MKTPISLIFIAGLLLSACQNISKEELSALKSEKSTLAMEKSALEAKNIALQQTISELNLRLAEEISEKQVLIEQSAQGDVRVTLQQSILFDSASFEIDAQGYAVLQKVADSMLNLSHDQNILIIGHTDNMPVSKKWRDMFTDNWDLSARRAGQVARHLIWGQGFAPATISVVGKAHTQPIASNDTEEGRAQNRRIEIFIKK